MIFENYSMSLDSMLKTEIHCKLKIALSSIDFKFHDETYFRIF